MSYLELNAARDTPPDLARVVDRVRYYGNGKFAFGVMAHGTCFFPQIGESFAAEANKLLDALQSAPLDFTVKEMDDHNFVVRFGEHVFAVVFCDEFESACLKLESEAQGPQISERLVGLPTAPKEHALIGVFARTRLLQDLRERQVLQMVQGA